MIRTDRRSIESGRSSSGPSSGIYDLSDGTGPQRNGTDRPMRALSILPSGPTVKQRRSTATKQERIEIMLPRTATI
jgi:hypothetical protein